MKSKPRSRKRTLIEWGLLIGILLFLNLTSYGTVAQSWLQRGILWTGLIKPDIHFAEKNIVPANYDVQLTRLDGSQVSLEEFRGKVIFMNLWATWCPPCLAEMPFIQNLYEDLGEENIAFVMISADDDAETARKFVEANDYTFPVFQLINGMPQPYTSNALPTTYVISADGNLATVHSGMAKYDSKEFKEFLRDLMSDTGSSG